MKTLVTGATGFLGGAVARAMSPSDVVLTGRNPEKAKPLVEQGYDVRLADLSDATVIDDLFSEVSCVIHCAAKSSLWGPASEFYRANVLATENLLYAAQRHSVRRFVHISTPSLYFNYSDRLGVREDEPLPKQFANAYTASKYQAE